MNLINKYKAVIAIILIVLILIIIRFLSPGHFKPDAKKWAEPSVKQSNIITVKDIETLQGEKLIINMDKAESGMGNISGDVHYIKPDSLFSKKNLNTIKNYKGPVLLFSSETAVSVRIWMLLSQLGYSNIFILTSVRDNETLKYKFRPDTITGPEL